MQRRSESAGTSMSGPGALGRSIVNRRTYCHRKQGGDLLLWQCSLSGPEGMRRVVHSEALDVLEGYGIGRQKALQKREKWNACTHTHTHTHTYTHIHTYTHTHINITHIHTYTHTHIQQIYHSTQIKIFSNAVLNTTESEIMLITISGWLCTSTNTCYTSVLRKLPRLFSMR